MLWALHPECPLPDRLIGTVRPSALSVKGARGVYSGWAERLLVLLLLVVAALAASTGVAQAKTVNVDISLWRQSPTAAEKRQYEKTLTGFFGTRCGQDGAVSRIEWRCTGYRCAVEREELR